jgi:predicted O-linked N-acetylglucosamine transferase (SPINDLY family)
MPAATYADIGALQQRWAARHGQPNAQLADARFKPFDGKRRVRVGYHCSFMESDTVRYILGKVIAAHDRTKFDIYGFTPDPLSRDMASVFDVVVDTALISDDDFVRLVRSYEIDVFVELSGFSPGHRFSAMASRCAPVQISNLNHHATSCVPNVDYIISDSVCTPPDSGAQAYFTEQIYRLPGCLLCYDYDGFAYPPVREDPPMIAAKSVTFGCFGSGGKISVPLIEIWAELLRRVPDAKLYIRNGQLSGNDNRRYMADRFRWHGIDSDRLRLEGGTDRATLLRCYDEVDISLDTWPYCGGNTVAEALWQGVPVVTYLGERFSSRYGASLLMAAGCNDLVGRSSEEYIRIAAALARNPDRLSYLRSNLRRMYREHGLGDSTQFARNLERAFMEMLEQSFVGQNGEVAQV